MWPESQTFSSLFFFFIVLSAVPLHQQFVKIDSWNKISLLKKRRKVWRIQFMWISEYSVNGFILLPKAVWRKKSKCLFLFKLFSLVI